MTCGAMTSGAMACGGSARHARVRLIACRPPSGPGTLRRHQFVEHAVDELVRLPAAKPLGQLNHFVQHDGWRRLRMQQLEDAQPQQIAIDRRHAIQRPVRSLTAQRRVDLDTAPPHPGNDSASERDQRVDIAEPPAEEFVSLGQVALRIEIVRIEDLKSDFAGATAIEWHPKRALCS
jgi:hypothetical protein